MAGRKTAMAAPIPSNEAVYTGQRQLRSLVKPTLIPVVAKSSDPAQVMLGATRAYTSIAAPDTSDVIGGGRGVRNRRLLQWRGAAHAVDASLAVPR